MTATGKICEAKGTDEFGDWDCRKSADWKDGGKKGYCGGHCHQWDKHGKVWRIGVQAMINNVCHASGEREDLTIWECLAPNEGKHCHGLCPLHHKQVKAGNGLTENSGDGWKLGVAESCRASGVDIDGTTWICTEPAGRPNRGNKDYCRVHYSQHLKIRKGLRKSFDPIKYVENKDMICKTPDCGKPVRAKGLCAGCWAKADRQAKTAAGIWCEFNCTDDEGEERRCDNPVRAKGKGGDGDGMALCATHWEQNNTHGRMWPIAVPCDNEFCDAGDGKDWDCEREAGMYSGLCAVHRGQLRRFNGDRSKLTPIWKPLFPNKICRAKGKDKEGKWKCGNGVGWSMNSGGAKGLCSFHYDHHYVKGTPLDKLPRYRPRKVAKGGIKIRNSLRYNNTRLKRIMENPDDSSVWIRRTHKRLYAHQSVLTWWMDRKWDVAVPNIDVSFWSGRSFIDFDYDDRAESRTFDHIFPISLAIPHAMKWPAWKIWRFKYDIRNIVPATLAENTAKSDRMPHEWLKFVYEDEETGKAVKYVTCNESEIVRRWQAICITYGIDEHKYKEDDPIVSKHFKTAKWRKMWAGALVEAAEMRVLERKATRHGRPA